ncbi:MAG: PAS domain S-box protein [Labilithrix sp.]|nr:PAS domain S-box protein [Labilithrix sp.]
MTEGQPTNTVVSTAPAESRFRNVIDAAPDGIVVSREATILFLNPAASRMLGYDDPEDLVGKHMSTFLGPDELARMGERIGHMLREGRPLAPQEYRARRLDGSSLVVEISSLFLDWDGAPATVALARDVTDRARASEQLARSDRLSALGTLAAGVAHEINNPLSYVWLGLSSLEKLVGPGPETTRIFDELRTGLDRVSAIVRDLQTFARPETAPGASADLGAVIAAVERLLAHAVGPRIELVLEVSETPHVVGSPSRLEQALAHLIGHAVQSFDSRPALDRAPRVTVRSQRLESGRVGIEVSDNGPGIPPEMVDRVFDPFFTALGVGAGLGLAISHRMIVQLGGELSVESRVGEGTTFRITLPAHEETSPVSATPAPRADTARWRILVVDDEPAIGRCLQRLLYRHEVDVVTSGAEAVARLCADGAYDAVLCDLMMPSVTGMDVHATIKKERPGMERRFVFMSGGVFTRKAMTFLTEIPNVRLDKPFSITAIEAALAETIALAGS